MRLSQPLAALALLAGTTHAHPVDQFQNTGSTAWGYMRNLLHTNCRAVYDTYQAGKSNSTSTWKTQAVAVVECVLENMSEVRKANLAVSAVVLGSTPMVLQSLGSGSVELALLGLRRPILALLLSGSSPSVAPMKGSEYLELLSTFVEGGETRHLALPGFAFDRIPLGFRPWVSVLEYLLVGGAVANVCHLGWQLGFRGIVSFAPDFRWMPQTWTLIAVLLHVASSLGLRLRVRLRRAPMARDVYRWAPDELVPSAYQPATYLYWKPENLAFYALMWFLGVLTVTNVIFGTLVLSSLLFFNGTDAVKIVARFAASAIAARMVVRFELAGMKEVTKYQKIKDGEVNEAELQPVNAQNTVNVSAGKGQLVDRTGRRSVEWRE